MDACMQTPAFEVNEAGRRLTIGGGVIVFVVNHHLKGLAHNFIASWAHFDFEPSSGHWNGQ